MARMLNTKQVAETLRVSTSTVRKYLNNGFINGERVGREWWITETDLDVFLHRNTKTVVPSRVSARGFLAGLPGFCTEEHLKNKQEEIEIEEEKFRKHF